MDRVAQLPTSRFGDDEMFAETVEYAHAHAHQSVKLVVVATSDS